MTMETHTNDTRRNHDDDIMLPRKRKSMGQALREMLLKKLMTPPAILPNSNDVVKSGVVHCKRSTMIPGKTWRKRFIVLCDDSKGSMSSLQVFRNETEWSRGDRAEEHHVFDRVTWIDHFKRSKRFPHAIAVYVLDRLPLMVATDTAQETLEWLVALRLLVFKSRSSVSPESSPLLQSIPHHRPQSMYRSRSLPPTSAESLVVGGSKFATTPTTGTRNGSPRVIHTRLDQVVPVGVRPRSSPALDRSSSPLGNRSPRVSPRIARTPSPILPRTDEDDQLHSIPVSLRSTPASLSTGLYGDYMLSLHEVCGGGGGVLLLKDVASLSTAAKWPLKHIIRYTTERDGERDIVTLDMKYGRHQGVYEFETPSGTTLLDKIRSTRVSLESCNMSDSETQRGSWASPDNSPDTTLHRVMNRSSTFSGCSLSLMDRDVPRMRREATFPVGSTPLDTVPQTRMCTASECVNQHQDPRREGKEEKHPSHNSVDDVGYLQLLEDVIEADHPTTPTSDSLLRQPINVCSCDAPPTPLPRLHDSPPPRPHDSPPPRPRPRTKPTITKHSRKPLPPLPQAIVSN